APLMRRFSRSGIASSLGRPMVNRQCSGSAGSVPSSASSARHACRWCAPLSISTPSISKIAVVVTTRSKLAERLSGRPAGGGRNGCPRLGECGGHFWAPAYEELEELDECPQSSLQSIQRCEQVEGLARGPRVLAGLPLGRFLRGDAAAEDELAVARAQELVAEPGHRVGGQVGEDGRRRLVVLVL